MLRGETAPWPSSRQMRHQDLQRRAAAEGQLDRLVNDTHAPLADFAKDLESRDRRQWLPMRHWFRLIQEGIVRIIGLRADRVPIAATRLAWRTLFLERSQEAGLGFVLAGAWSRTGSRNRASFRATANSSNRCWQFRHPSTWSSTAWRWRWSSRSSSKRSICSKRHAEVHRSVLLSKPAERVDVRRCWYYSIRDASGSSSRALTSLRRPFIT